MFYKSQSTVTSCTHTVALLQLPLFIANQGQAKAKAKARGGGSKEEKETTPGITDQTRDTSLMLSTLC